MLSRVALQHPTLSTRWHIVRFCHECRYTWTVSSSSLVRSLCLCGFLSRSPSLSLIFGLSFYPPPLIHQKNTIINIIRFGHIFCVSVIGFLNYFNDVHVFAQLLTGPCQNTVGCKRSIHFMWKHITLEIVTLKNLHHNIIWNAFQFLLRIFVLIAWNGE